MTKRPYALMNMPVPIKDRTEALPDSDAKESSPLMGAEIDPDQLMPGSIVSIPPRT